MPVTASEALVERLCKRSFLSLWSHGNPSSNKGKELCDFLVVCDPDVILFSVKEVDLPATDSVAADRWQRRAVDASVKQLHGAARRLETMTAVRRGHGRPDLLLPPPDRRQVHRVAVALGSNGQLPIEQGDFGKGFVHVLDDESLGRVMAELDTISDFVEYLNAKQALVDGGSLQVAVGAERDLLAVYLHNGRRFPPGKPRIVDVAGAWEELTAKPEWQRRKQADRVSYVWDELIEGVARDVLGPGLQFGGSDAAERSMRRIAREDRFARRVLGDAFMDFMALATAGTVRSRAVTSPSNVSYVFLACDKHEPRESRVKELGLRCYAVRNMMARYAPVIGLARERYVPGDGSSLDVCYLDIPKWTDEHRRMAEAMQADLGYFTAPVRSRTSHDEYPPEKRI